MTPAVPVREAAPGDLPELSRLFDAYRVFYRQPSDPAAAERFLRERFARRDSHLFVAPAGNSLVAPAGDSLVAPAGDSLAGFAQLYPSLSSVAMARIFVLNDLFVDPAARRGGVGRALLEAAHAFASQEGAVRVSLETAVDNAAAQRLYESLGYVRDSAFHRYHWRISRAAGLT